MIDTLDANSKVGRVEIGLYNKHIKWDDEIIVMMIDRYINVYWIGVIDYNN